MTTLNPETQSIAAAFEKYSSVTPGQAQNLSASIKASSALAEKSNSAALSRRRCLSLLLGTVLLAVCASQSSLAALSPIKEASSMSRSAGADQNGANTTSIHPILNAEQVLTRLLALIRGSRSVHEFTPEYLSEKMGVPFATYRPGYYAFGERVTLDWRYNMEMNEHVLPDIGARFSFSFDSRPGISSPPMTDICQVDLDQFRTELEAMGFSSKPYYGEHGRLINFTFNGPNLYIEVYPRGEGHDPLEKIRHLCVETILMS